MSKDFRILCNWPIAHGDLNKIIDVKYKKDSNDSFQRDDISDIISDEKIVLFENDGKIQENCQITLNIKPTFNLCSIALITSRSVIELFKGSFLEYYSTMQGDFIADYDGTRTYRYDLVFSTKNLTPITIKFIASLTEGIWLFGMQIVLTENKNFLQNTLQSSATTVPILNPASLIEMKSVQNPGAINLDKCRALIECYSNLMGTRNNNSRPLNLDDGNISSSLSAKPTSNNNFLSKPTMQPLNMDDQLNGNSSSSLTETTIKSYIDQKFIAFESSINEKLDKIISLLQDNNNKN